MCRVVVPPPLLYRQTSRAAAPVTASGSGARSPAWRGSGCVAAAQGAPLAGELPAPRSRAGGCFPGRPGQEASPGPVTAAPPASEADAGHTSGPCAAPRSPARARAVAPRSPLGREPGSPQRGSEGRCLPLPSLRRLPGSTAPRSGEAGAAGPGAAPLTAAVPRAPVLPLPLPLPGGGGSGAGGTSPRSSGRRELPPSLPRGASAGTGWAAAPGAEAGAGATIAAGPGSSAGA